MCVNWKHEILFFNSISFIYDIAQKKKGYNFVINRKNIIDYVQNKKIQNFQRFQCFNSDVRYIKRAYCDIHYRNVRTREFEIIQF